MNCPTTKGSYDWNIPVPITWYPTIQQLLQQVCHLIYILTLEESLSNTVNTCIIHSQTLFSTRWALKGATNVHVRAIFSGRIKKYIFIYKLLPSPNTEWEISLSVHIYIFSKQAGTKGTRQCCHIPHKSSWFAGWKIYIYIITTCISQFRQNDNTFWDNYTKQPISETHITVDNSPKNYRKIEISCNSNKNRTPTFGFGGSKILLGLKSGNAFTRSLLILNHWIGHWSFKLLIQILVHSSIFLASVFPPHSMHVPTVRCLQFSRILLIHFPNFFMACIEDTSQFEGKQKNSCPNCQIEATSSNHDFAVPFKTENIADKTVQQMLENSNYCSKTIQQIWHSLIQINNVKSQICTNAHKKNIKINDMQVTSSTRCMVSH